MWQVESPLARTALIALYWLGWLIVLLATFLLSHFELFGIKQAIDGFRPRSAPVETFRTPFFYKLVRHPLYLGFLILFWATPDMSVGHLLFALACSTYIVIGTRLEERDLLQVFGTTYQHYQQRVGMLLPRLGRHRGSK
ncbi:methyltransferase family protein [Pseudomonas sp. microsymbiont 2]